MLTGNTSLYRKDDFDHPELLHQVAGCFLNLDVVPVHNGGLARAGEDFTVVCGFSAALAPLWIEQTLDAVFGRKYFATVESLPGSKAS